jgi:E3 ubiquitin-protein ligase CCNP1IP1
LRNSVDYSDGLGDLHADFERELDLERRKNRDLQETSRERDKEYQKLKV